MQTHLIKKMHKQENIEVAAPQERWTEKFSLSTIEGRYREKS